LEIISSIVQAYADRFSADEDEVLKAISDDTKATHSDWHMLSGHVQGKFLQLFSSILQPAYILEIGTFTGYSAICLARGLNPGGELHTIELREDDAAIAQANFNRANIADRIILHTGNALQIIPTLNYQWDLVFIDADKTGYIEYYNLVVPKLRSGGIILADNVLFHGQVLEETIKGKSAKAIQLFNEHVRSDESVENVILTIRDGLMLIRKK
jgi:caffeoyl-CoA O-methyltransferase